MTTEDMVVAQILPDGGERRSAICTEEMVAAIGRADYRGNPLIWWVLVPTLTLGPVVIGMFHADLADLSGTAIDAVGLLVTGAVVCVFMIGTLLRSGAPRAQEAKTPVGSLVPCPGHRPTTVIRSPSPTAPAAPTWCVRSAWPTRCSSTG